MFFNTNSISAVQIPPQYKEGKSEIKREENHISKIFYENLSESRESISRESIEEETIRLEKLKQLFEVRYAAPFPWPGFSVGEGFDCEKFAHYLMTGRVAEFEKTQESTIRRINLEITHAPYTVYKLWRPSRLDNGWAFVHFFTHLVDGKYISKGGLGPIKTFSSFEEMVKEHVFSYGFFTKDLHLTDDIEEAVIGQSIVGTIHD